MLMATQECNSNDHLYTSHPYPQVPVRAVCENDCMRVEKKRLHFPGSRHATIPDKRIFVLAAFARLSLVGLWKLRAVQDFLVNINSTFHILPNCWKT